MRVLLVALDAAVTSTIEHRTRLAGGVRIVTAAEQEAVEAATSGDPPAAAVISDRTRDPIRVAQALAAVDRETAITILCTPEREAELRDALRFAPLVTAHTTCRSTADVEQLGVDLVEAAQAAVRRREHHASVEAATRRLSNGAPTPRLRGEALGRLVEMAPIGVVTLTAAHAVGALNAHAAHILGAPEHEVVGRPVQELFDAGERDRFGGFLAGVGRGRGEAGPEIFRRLGPAGEQFVELTAGPALSQSGDPGALLILSDVTERILVERARERAEQAHAFLAETGALLDASLDPVETLQKIASLAVPERAELCLIDLLTEEGRIDGVAFAAIDDDVARAVQDIRERYPVDPHGAHPVARVLRTGRAEILEEMTDETYRRIAQSDEHLSLMRRLHYSSALVAPLAARGRRYGAVSLLYLDRRRKYTHEDMRTLDDVARRAALALDNARLYARERRIAETLQRSLLPARLPDVPGVTLAAHYEPGEGDVGGDWYDVIPLPDGRVGCVVGDIVGRGIEAASVMGQLRNAVRVYALERRTANEVVDAVDRLSDSLGMREMATIAYVILHPVERTVEVCCAGHPPPLVVAPDGRTRYVLGGRSGPVGVGLAQTHASVTEPFPPGSLLLLYTDGLIERRGTRIDDGLAKLEAAAVAAAEREPAELARGVVAALRPGPSSDDVALLVLRADPVGDRLKVSVQADSGNVGAIRTELRRWLHGRLPDEDLYEVVLACSEACANVVEHAYAIRRGRLEVEGRVDGDELTLLVRDFGRWRREGLSRRGRGRGIMSEAMDRVDVTTGDQGTEVLMRRRLRSSASA